MKERECILVVCEDGETKSVLKTVLEVNYRLLEVKNGKQALVLLEAKPKEYLAVIADYEATSMSGADLLVKMKQDTSLCKIPVIVLTRAGLEKEESDMIAQGAFDIIRKPFYAEVLKNRMDHLMKIVRQPSFRNMMVDMLDQEVDECIKTMHLCGCKQCREDLMALALNHVKPKYVSSQKGEVFSKIGNMSYDAKVEIISAIAKAANTVKEKPRHE